MQESRRMRVPLSILMSVLILMVSTQCTNYYQVKTEEEEEEKREAFTKVLNQDKYFIVSSGAQRMLAENIEFGDNQLTMQLSPVPAWIDSLYSHHIMQGKKRYYGAEGKKILNEVRIALTDTPLEAGALTVPLSAVSRVDIIQHDAGRVVLTYLGVIVGAFVLVVIIIALTKSSCPFVYSYDGENYSLEGEAFGGAIFAPVERDDYLPLHALKAVDGEYLLKIRNELKERQFINNVSLLVVDRPENAEVMTDRHGKIYSVTNPKGPVVAVSGNGAELRPDLFQRDDQVYRFDDPAPESAVDEVKLTFRVPADVRGAKLVLNTKGSLWLDYLYGEFIGKFGNYYNEWAEGQKTKSREELETWFFEQHLPLKVSVWSGTEWRYVDYVHLIGPLADERDVVVSLDKYLTPGMKQVEVKIESGYMFWDLDYAAMDFSENIQLQVQEVFPSKALTQNQESRLEEVMGTDGAYAAQLSIGDELTLHFPAEENNAMVFMKIRGYYEHIRDFEGTPDFLELFSFRKPGKFASFSRERFEEIAAPIKESVATNVYADAN